MLRKKPGPLTAEQVQERAQAKIQELEEEYNFSPDTDPTSIALRSPKAQAAWGVYVGLITTYGVSMSKISLLDQITAR